MATHVQNLLARAMHVTPGVNQPLQRYPATRIPQALRNPSPRISRTLPFPRMAKKSDDPAAKPQPSKVEDEEEIEEVEDEEDDDDTEEDEEEDESSDDAAAAAADDLSNKESIRQLLEPFGKDQLIDLLKEAASRDPALLSRISGTPAVVEPSQRKIFVHGLGWDATTESLTAAFSTYGDIEECRAVTDRATGRCKGYGFVLFRTLSATRKALKEPQKKIGNRMASCQLASLGSVPSHNQQPSIAASTMGLNPVALGFLNQNLVPQVGLVGQGLDPSVGYLGQGLNSGLMAHQMGGFAGQSAGFSTSLTTSDTNPPTYGAGLGIGGGGLSSSVTGRYDSLESLQGLGSYRSSPYSTNAALRYRQSDYGSSGSGLPPYMGRY